MELKKTLTNLRKTKESFFNVKSDSIVYFDIYKNNLISKTKDGIIFKIHNTKFINKHFINWDRRNEEKVIKTINYNYWFERVTDFYDIPFIKRAEFYYINNNPFIKGFIKTL